jgi:hypothetical protein
MAINEREILDQVNKSWNNCGEKCSKYVGALTAEVIRQALQNDGIPVSSRDVFIQGIPIEFDLIVPRHDAACPTDGILYKPDEVIAVLEIKASGLFDYKSKNRIETCRDKVQELNPNVFFGYVTLSERKSFHDKNFHEDEWTYPLFWWHPLKALKEHERYNSTGFWQKLLSELHKRVNAQ